MSDELKVDDSCGLSIDMLDADRLREWARLILVHGADISHWGSTTHVASKMQIMATEIEKAIRDIGQLRAALSAAQQENDTLRRQLPTEGVAFCAHCNWSHRYESSDPEAQETAAMLATVHASRCKHSPLLKRAEAAEASLATLRSAIEGIVRDMRIMEQVAGQASVEGPENAESRMAQAFAEHCWTWADALQRLCPPSGAAATP